MLWKFRNAHLPAVGLALSALLFSAAPASARVTVTPASLPAGVFSELSFRVPNEREGDIVSQFEVDLPVAVTIRSVKVRPMLGWHYRIETRALSKPVPSPSGLLKRVVSKVVWYGGHLNDAEYDDFAISIGPVPAGVPALSFPATETYRSGFAARYAQTPGDPHALPNRLAPTVAITARGARP